MASIRKGRALRIVVGIIALAILLLAGGAGTLSNSGGGSWHYYEEIPIRKIFLCGKIYNGNK